MAINLKRMHYLLPYKLSQFEQKLFQSMDILLKMNSNF